MSKLAINGGTPVRSTPFPRYNTIGEEEKRAVLAVLDTGVLSGFLGTWSPGFFGGTNVQKLERDWEAFFGVKHAVTVNSATSGLYAAVGAAGVGPGDEVIVSPYTMTASASAAVVYGAVPVFADIDEDTFCITPASIRERLSPYTKAIVVVDLLGYGRSDRSAGRGFWGNMAGHQAMGGAREASVGHQRDRLAQAGADNGPGDAKHFAHPRSAFRAFMADDDHVAGFDATSLHRCEGGFFAFEHTGRSAMNTEVVSGNLDDAAVGSEVAAENNQTTCRFQRRRHGANDFLSRRFLCLRGLFTDRLAGDGHCARV